MKEIPLREKHALSSTMGEVYNRLRTNIEFSGDENKVICVTSCSANDGKSTVSYYLARSMAKNGKKVLFIDADLRNSVMHHRMNFDKSTTGLSHYLVGKADIQDIVYKTSYDNLYFIPTGVFSRHPSELLGGQRFVQLLSGYRQIFDYIIIDTPPVGAVVDAVVVANNSDAYIIVISSGNNRKISVQKAIEDMSVSKSNFLGVVVNKISKATRNYYYRYSYNYDYNYGNPNSGSKN